MFYRVIICAAAFVLLYACGSEQGRPGADGPPDFAQHIAPVIHKNCTRCHVPGEAGPFSLITYEDVVRRAKLIKYVVKERIMPPWPADPTYSHFANEMVLSDEEIGLISRWVDEGMLPGDTASLEAPDRVKQSLGFGEPDLIIKVPPVKLKGNNKDLFLVMKIPVEIPQDTFVRAIEFVAGNKKLLHHMNGHLLLFEAGKKKDLHEGRMWVDQDQANSQRLHRELGILQDDGSYPAMTPSVSNYLPGALFSFYPEAIGGYKMNKQSAFYLNDLHFGPTSVDATDSSYFKIYFTDKQPKRPVREFQIGTLGVAPVVPELVVPAGAVKSFRTEVVIPEDISLVSIIPHMHLIGKKYIAYAVKPSGDTIPLIRINNWDFRWQYFYQFRNLLHIPAGTRICAEGVYDNTAQNPNNPFSPPREIRERNGSMRTTDEMFQLIVTYVPYQAGDERISQENP